MARPTRIEYEGAVYHVMARGDRGGLLYRDDEDRGVFLNTLGECCGKYGFRVHAYAVMGTHYHILLETPEANLVRGMTWLQTTYTVRFNRRHREFGHLFAGRYKALPVEPDGEYFRTVLDYIHLNPARAGLVGEGGPVAAYPWSSLAAYLSRPKERPAWLEVGRGLGESDCKDTPAGRRRFVENLDARWRAELAGQEGAPADGGGGAVGDALKRGWFYGGEEFRARLLDKADAILKRGVSDRNRASGAPADHGRAMAERIAREGLAALGIAESDLPAMRRGAPEKVAIAWLIRRQTSVRLRWIAERLAMGSVGNVSVHCGRFDAGDPRSAGGEEVVSRLRQNLEFIT